MVEARPRERFSVFAAFGGFLISLLGQVVALAVGGFMVEFEPSEGDARFYIGLILVEIILLVVAAALIVRRVYDIGAGMLFGLAAAAVAGLMIAGLAQLA